MIGSVKLCLMCSGLQLLTVWYGDFNEKFIVTQELLV